MVGTVTMEEVWRYAKTAIDLIFPRSDDLRKALAELQLSSDAEILSNPKNHRFLTIFLESHQISCSWGRTQNFFPKIFVCVWRLKNHFYNFVQKSAAFWQPSILCFLHIGIFGWLMRCGFSISMLYINLLILSYHLSPKSTVVSEEHGPQSQN